MRAIGPAVIAVRVNQKLANNGYDSNRNARAIVSSGGINTQH
jgi:hypothetical protein